MQAGILMTQVDGHISQTVTQCSGLCRSSTKQTTSRLHLVTARIVYLAALPVPVGQARQVGRVDLHTK